MRAPAQEAAEVAESCYPDAAKCPVEMAVGSSVPHAYKGQLGVSLQCSG